MGQSNEQSPKEVFEERGQKVVSQHKCPSKKGDDEAVAY